MKVSEAMAKTGLSERVLRGMVSRQEIRFRYVDRRHLVLHPEDVRVLSERGWSGRPVAGTD